MSCDSADRERVFEVVKTAVDTFGSIDVIVNNGQAIVPSQPVEDTEYENMLKAWQSGVIGSLNYMQAAFPPMKGFGDPEMDIAPVVAFLAGPDSCYFSGQSVIVDGANSIMP